jgi:hypothetical protein
MDDGDNNTKKKSSTGISSTLKAGKAAGKALVKVGKTGLKAGIKAGKTTVKTLETLNTLAGAAKDHTKRPVPTIVRVSKGGTEDSSWTDTDTIHFALENEQIPGYQRALSYQLGEMRLLVYNRVAGGKKNPIKSLEVVSVKYQATGIGGVLANKGGIIAEILINKTTKFSFLTAHLEAHEGESHFLGRITSLQDVSACLHDILLSWWKRSMVCC